MPRMVNFEVLMQRNAMYRDKECESLKRFEAKQGIEELARTCEAQFVTGETDNV